MAGRKENSGLVPESNPAPDLECTADPGTLSDEQHRRRAVARLAEQLDIGSGLTSHCEHIASLPAEDRLRAVFAAARLMNANAHVAKALADLAQVERRKRTIVERVQPPSPVSNDSNLSLTNSLIEQLQLRMLAYMNVVAAEEFDGPINEAIAAGKKGRAQRRG